MATRPYPNKTRIKTSSIRLCAIESGTTRPYPNKTRIKTISITFGSDMPVTTTRPYPNKTRIKTLFAPE